MRLYDDHLHSVFSFDGRFDPDLICAEAQKKGLAGITFTEHVEMYNNSYPDRIVDISPYENAVAAAEKKYPELKVGMGLEVGLKNDVPELRQFIEQTPWDFCIGSLHIMNELSIVCGEYVSGREPKSAYRCYFRQLADLAANIDLYDVLGHLDLFRRAVGWDDSNFDMGDYLDELDAIFAVLIDNGRGIELNTGGWRYHLDTPNPSFEIIKRYRQKGGEIITCGSDAHTLPSVGYRIADGYEILCQAGFRYFSRFKNRTLQQIPLY